MTRYVDYRLRREMGTLARYRFLFGTLPLQSVPMQVMSDSLRLYGTDQLIGSFNGGKDAVVIMHLHRCHMLSAESKHDSKELWWAVPLRLRSSTLMHSSSSSSFIFCEAGSAYISRRRVLFLSLAGIFGVNHHLM